jgi:ABC-type antimicrobial peptide transport system permease subunit
MVQREKWSGPGYFLLQRLLVDGEHDSLAGDFEEIYREMVEEKGTIAAFTWYWLQIFRLLPLFFLNKMYFGGIMIKNYLKITFRNIVKHKGYSFINIFGLAIGMAVSILILLWVHDELSFDRFHKNIETLHLVGLSQDYSTGQIRVPMSPAPLAPALKKEFPEIVDAARIQMCGDVQLKYEEKGFMESGGCYADPSFLEMFTFPLMKGDAKFVLADPHSIVLTEATKKKYFGDKEAIGKIINFQNEYNLTVTGIIENVPDNSSLDFDFIIPFEFIRKWGADLQLWGWNNYFTYVQLQQGMPYQQVSKKISGRIKQAEPDASSNLFLHPFKRIHLYSLSGTGGNIRYVYIFTLVALFVLFIACINFMNLSTARSVKRGKEVSLRKVVGANRKQLIIQFFGESILFSIIALFLAVLMVELCLPVFNHFSNKNVTIILHGNPSILIGLLGITLFTGIISGSYPALLLSSFKPVQVLKGTLKLGKGSSLFRKVLVVTQFVFSIILIISTAVVYNQLDYLQNKNLGVNKENVIYLPLQGNIRTKYETVKNELLKNTDILSVTTSSHIPTRITSNTTAWDWEGKNPDEKVLMGITFFGYDYTKTFKMEMAQGRFYSEEFASDASQAAVVNEKAVNIMGIDSPVGKRLTLGSTPLKIVGVLKDFHFKSLHREIGPIVSVLDPTEQHFMFIRINGENVSGAVNYIEKIYKKIEPGYPAVLAFLDDAFDQLYRSENRMGKLFKYFAFFAVFISCLGLFGLASFMGEQRTKEIGVRKVLGAKVAGIVLLFSREFTKWVLLANIIAWPAAYFAMTKWLDNFAYRSAIGVEVFILSAFLSLAIAFLTVSYQSIKAAIASPVKALKYE